MMLVELTPEQVAALTPAERMELVRLLDIQDTAKKRNKIDEYFPDEGPLRREAYPKHMEFFEAGAKYRERCAMCANRVGKTETMGGYETALHLTGIYPHWWKGRRFDKPVQWWAAGKTNKTTRDIVQAKLFGKIAYNGSRKTVAGTGLIRGAKIGGIAWKQGVQDLIDTVLIKHETNGVFDGYSELGVKSYQQGRGSFEGTEKDGIWLDEEPPIDIYGECLIRTVTTNGLIYITFTPLDGVTETVLQFLPNGMEA